MTPIMLRDSELAGLSRHEVLAIEHLLHERMSEIARTRKAGDSALLLAIRAADYLAPLLADLGDEATADLLAETARSETARVALDRAEAVARLTAAEAA